VASVTKTLIGVYPSFNALHNLWFATYKYNEYGRENKEHSATYVLEKRLFTDNLELVGQVNCCWLSPAFADRGCHVVSVTDLYGHIPGFLDRSRYFFFQVAPQL
jgi:hypothetical protein